MKKPLLKIIYLTRSNHFLFKFLTKFFSTLTHSVNKDCVTYIGPFNSWKKALNASSGYNDPSITKKSNAALDMILSGTKTCEKDGILFDNFQYSLPLILGINYIQKSVSQITVLDYGGSFASSYFRNLDILRELDIRWIVVEQASIIQIAKQKLSRYRELEFISDNDFREKRSILNYNVLLLGSSLQFFENPKAEITKLIHEGPKALVIEQTPFVLSGTRQLTVQQVREPIYDSSYPAWHFEEKEFMDWIGNQYVLRYQSHNAHVTNHCNNFSSKLNDYVFTDVSLSN